MAPSRPVVRALAAVAALALLTAACGGGGKKAATKASSTTSGAGHEHHRRRHQHHSGRRGDGDDQGGWGDGHDQGGRQGQRPGVGQLHAARRIHGGDAGKAWHLQVRHQRQLELRRPDELAAPVTPLMVDPPAGTRQHSTHDMRKPDGTGSVSETTLDFQPQGVLLVELKITTKALGITDVQDFVANPPVNVAPTGVKPGQSVEFDISGSGTNVHVKIDFVRIERLTIGGQAVDTPVTHQVGTFRARSPAPRHRTARCPRQSSLFVSDHTVADVTAYGAKAHSDITTTLQKLTPG